MRQWYRRLLFFSQNNGDKFSTEDPKKDLMDLLVEKTISAGHMLSFKEVSEDPEMVCPNNYAFYFGSFSEAANITWRRAKSSSGSSGSLFEQNHGLTKGLMQAYQTAKPHRKEVSWMSELQEKEHKGKSSRYTAEEVKKALVDFYNRTGKLPNQNDTRRYDSGLPSWGTLIRFLGPKSGWNTIISGTDIASVPQKNASIVESMSTAPNILAEETTTEEAAINNPQEETTATESPEAASVASQSDDTIKVETAHQEQDNLAAIEVKITLPNREKSIVITLTV